MIGKTEQIDQAERIKGRINAEFDRIARALESSAAKQDGQDRVDVETVIIILEEKRAEVMAKGRADYFIHSWREVGTQVRALIAQDSRYRAINTKRALRKH